jgi:hypothetical protein
MRTLPQKTAKRWLLLIKENCIPLFANQKKENKTKTAFPPSKQKKNCKSRNTCDQLHGEVAKSEKVAGGATQLSPPPF